MDVGEDKWDAFVQWFQALPGTTFSDSVKLADLRSQKAGHGIVATQDIPAGTVLFTIPRNKVFYFWTCGMRKRTWPDLLVFRQWDQVEEPKWDMMILMLMYEHFQGKKSHWKPYLDVLPRTHQTPIFWTDEEIAELQASPIVGRIGREKADEHFMKAVVPYIRARPRLFPGSKKMGDGELVHLAHVMGSIIMAYSFEMPGREYESSEERESKGSCDSEEDWQDVMGLVPMADMLNADAEFNARVNYDDDDEKFEVTAVRDIKAGEEVLNNYGPHGNGELLRRYGYVTPKHARYDVVELPWDVLSETFMEKVGVSQEKFHRIELCLDDRLEQLEDEVDDPDVFRLRDAWPLWRETEEPTEDGTLSKSAPGNGFVMEHQELFSLLCDAMRKEDPPSMADKRRVRKAELTALIKAVDAAVANYPTSIGEDERLLEGEEEERRRMAIVVRLGEKRLLKEAREYFTSRLEEDEQPSSKRKR